MVLGGLGNSLAMTPVDELSLHGMCDIHPLVFGLLYFLDIGVSVMSAWHYMRSLAGWSFQCERMK